MLSRLVCWLFGHEKRWVSYRSPGGRSEIITWCDRCGEQGDFIYTILSPPPLEGEK